MATVDEGYSAKKWLPLEANPDVMNQVLLHSPVSLLIPQSISRFEISRVFSVIVLIGLYSIFGDLVLLLMKQSAMMCLG